ncbi:MAG: DNA methyltransferase [Planctomycetaceae bacterium]|nr:DNA methyltransferase [Planctomycetaceae bacterium]
MDEPRKPRQHCNELDGKRWLQNSISVWSDIRKTTEENRLKHPAMFPSSLVERLVETFLRPEGQVIIDPFAGSGSTIVAAERLGKTGIGFELSEEYVELANQRLRAIYHSDAELFPSDETPIDNGRSEPASIVHHASAERLLELVDEESVDLCISSPPYWNILNQRRTADMKQTRHYGNLEGDLGTIEDYNEFLTVATNVYADVCKLLKPGGYCCIVVMDLRKKSQFFPLHSDLATRLSQVGYIFDDLIIWNRQSEYNNLRPLGYPSVFRINKVHEYIVLMQKPREKK